MNKMFPKWAKEKNIQSHVDAFIGRQIALGRMKPNAVRKRPLGVSQVEWFIRSADVQKRLFGFSGNMKIAAKARFSWYEDTGNWYDELTYKTGSFEEFKRALTLKTALTFAQVAKKQKNPNFSYLIGKEVRMVENGGIARHTLKHSKPYKTRGNTDEKHSKPRS